MDTSLNRATSTTWNFHAATSYRALPARSPEDEPEYVMGTVPPFEPPIWQEDWSLEPRASKSYVGLPTIALPSDLVPTSISALEALARVGTEPDLPAPTPGLRTLAQIARLSNGLLNRRQRRGHGGFVEFRTAGGTGGRYHLEQYVVCGDLPDLDAGVYHYDTTTHGLRPLRQGDLRGALVAACGGDQKLADAPLALVLTSTFWRNAFRYRARAYRHTYWDAGTSLANVLSVAASLGQPTRLLLGFVDAEVNHLLGVDGEREAAVAVCAIGRGCPTPAPPHHIDPITHPTEPISPAEITFAQIPLMHSASSLTSADEVVAWRGQPLHRERGHAAGPGDIPLRPRPTGAWPARTIGDVILGRRSRRRFALDRSLAFEDFSTVLERSAHGTDADWLAVAAQPVDDSYLIVNDVESLEPGVYRFHPDRSVLSLIRAGAFRQQAAHIAFDQDYVGDAHVNSYYLADLHAVLAAYGNRGYRVAQLEAALTAGRLHLAAEALGLGACGSTSFDQEVVDLFSPPAARSTYMFVTVFGVRRRAEMPA